MTVSFTKTDRRNGHKFCILCGKKIDLGSKSVYNKTKGKPDIYIGYIKKLYPRLCLQTIKMNNREYRSITYFGYNSFKVLKKAKICGYRFQRVSPSFKWSKFFEQGNEIPG